MSSQEITTFIPEVRTQPAGSPITLGTKSSHRTETGAPTCIRRWKPLPAVGMKQQFSRRSGGKCETSWSNLRHRECKVCSIVLTEIVAHRI